MRSLLTTLLFLAMTCMTGMAAAQDPMREMDSLSRLTMRDSSALGRALDPDAWERAGGPVHEVAMRGLVSGSLLQGRAKPDAAVQVLDRVIELLGGTNEERLLACVYYYRGRADLVRNNIAGAIVQFERAMRITPRLNYPRLDTKLEEGIGRAYAELLEHEKARTHLLRALAMTDDPLAEFAIRSVLAETAAALGYFDEADAQVRRMKTIADSTGMDPSMVDLSNGELALARGLPEMAITHFTKALDHYMDANASVTYRAWTMSRLSKACRLAGHDHLAVEWARQGLQVCARYHLAKETQDNERELYQAYAALGDKPAAFDHLQRYLALKDSATGVVASGIVGTTVLRAELERQARADSLLRAEREQRVDLERRSEGARQRYIRNVTLLIAGAVLLLAVGLWNRLRFTRRSREEIRREKDISEGLLLNILPAEVAQELKQNGAAEARLMEHVTVLFTDFKGFTAYSEKLSPRELVKDIHECFSAFDGIMEEHGIEKIKTIGDAYMAVGGLPTANSTHALDVVKAALEIREFIAEGKARKIDLGLPYFEIRIGVHTGPVVAGIVGVKKFQYDIWGDTVNTASRLESSGEVGMVNISEATYALVKNEPGIRFTHRGRISAKGKGELNMYYVEREADGSRTAVPLVERVH